MFRQDLYPIVHCFGQYMRLVTPTPRVSYGQSLVNIVQMNTFLSCLGFELWFNEFSCGCLGLEMA